MPELPKKVLIIKTGFSETLTPEIQESVVSLGDVLRTTAILHPYKNDEVIWLTSQEAIPLLDNNPYISEVLPLTLLNTIRLQHEMFDVVINLEKIPGLCALGESVHAWEKYGFRFDVRTGQAESYKHAADALYVASDLERKKQNTMHWLEWLYEIIDRKWEGESPILSPKRYIDAKDIVGFNYKIGQKFNSKALPFHMWEWIGKSLDKGTIDYCWQPDETTIDEYIEWIQSCKIIVTNDSLGLHIALALGKRVVGLFGPTPSKEVYQPYNCIWIQHDEMSEFTEREIVDAITKLGGIND